MKIYLKLVLFVLFAVATAFAARALSPVAAAVGPNEFPEGDSVTIVEVLSDSPSLEAGSRVVVRGRYTLASQSKARIGLSQTRTESRAPVPILSGSGKEISKGSGEFELVYEVTQVGCMRVALNDVTPGPSFGTVYFGTPEQLARVKREVRGWVKK
jgi:hypothetical protein